MPHAPLRAATLALAVLALPAAARAQAPVPPAAESHDRWTVPALPAPAPVPAAEYAARRAALLRSLDTDGVVVVLGADEADADYLPYAQYASFRYLTGIAEPGAALVMERRGTRTRELLFVLPRSPSREVWEGVRMGAEGARQATGMEARTEGMEAALDSMLAAGGGFFLVSPLSPDGSRSHWLRPDQQFAAQVSTRFPSIRPQWIDSKVFALRARKSPAELDVLRRSILITVLAQREAMRAVEPGMNEFEVQAVIDGTFRRNGAERPSFGSIVGSGPNSTTLHYRTADRFMEAGDMLVMDIGSSYRGYAADITRTVPVTGRFTAEQRAIYETVLAAQKAAEAEARPGATFGTLSQAASRVLAEGLTRLGLIESPTATYQCRPNGGQCPQLSLFYLHGLGHGIGFDVHDPDAVYPPYGGSFQVGSAFTIEPGIYVRADALDYLPDTPENRALVQKLRPAVQRYRNIGVRIEDDYFITPDGVERVSEGAPREIAEIEALMADRSHWNAERRGGVVEWYRPVAP